MVSVLLAAAGDDPDRNLKGLICALVAVIIGCALLAGRKKR
jgi:hypothetical protein